jgi:hypothetical protein
MLVAVKFRVMTEEMKQKLIDAGCKDLVEIYEINQSGYAGINPNGNIVDRRKFPKAVPVQKNEMLNIPEPKKLDNE